MITIGNFIGAVINFFVVAIVLFFIMKASNAATELATKNKKAEEAAAVEEVPEPSDEVKLLTEIRDLLVESNK